MIQQKLIVVEDIGEVIHKRSSKFRRLSVRMAPDKGIWVNIPNGFSFSQGEAMVKENKSWILSQLPRIKKREAARTIFTASKPFATRYHKLQIHRSPQPQLKARLSDGSLHILCPEQLKETDAQVQEFISRAVIETLRREAQQYLPQRIEQLARKFGFRYHSVKIRNARTRWGSCSGEDHISLNLHLMRLPQHLLDYVILHELCHTIEKNHSSKFWALMKRVCPLVQQYRQEMKEYTLVIF